MRSEEMMASLRDVTVGDHVVLAVHTYMAPVGIVLCLDPRRGLADDRKRWGAAVVDDPD